MKKIIVRLRNHFEAWSDEELDIVTLECGHRIAMKHSAKKKINCPFCKK